MPRYSEEDIYRKYPVGFVDTHCHLDFLYGRLGFDGTFEEFRESEFMKFPPSFEKCVAVFCDPQTFSNVS